MDLEEPKKMEINKELIAASSTPIVLAILADEDSYGYAILLRVKELSGGRMEWTDGMLYPLLHRLEKAGLTKAEWRLEDEGARPRKYYALTDSGRADLAVQLESWRRISSTLGAFLERTNP